MPITPPPRPAPAGGADILRRLRGDGAPRPPVDPGLAGGLRDWLEDGLAPSVAKLPAEHEVVRINKESLNQVLVCEAHLTACRLAPRTVTVELSRGSLVDALFRQWVTVGEIGDPWADALAALEVEGDRDGVVRFVTDLPAAARRRLVDEVAQHAAGIVQRWPVPSPSSMARTQERLDIPLCGGRVVLAGVVDLVLGGPARDEASVCIVELKSGARHVEHRGDVHLYALLETLRSGAPPFRIATYYSATGELDVEPVGEDAMVSALHAPARRGDPVVPPGHGGRACPHPQPAVRMVHGIALVRAGPGAGRHVGPARPRTAP